MAGATTTRAAPDQRFLLETADWATYQRVLAALGERHVFVTYDRGRLELMSPSHEHERYKTLLGRLIEVMALELDIDVHSGGSTTFQRADLEKGLEPDECYWIQNEPLVRERDEIDLARDPAPDLVLEVDVSRSSINRQAIYAALGVPELWRYDGASLRVFRLESDGTYRVAEGSRCFPFLPVREFEAILVAPEPKRENERVRRFQDWVRRFRKQS